MSDKDVQLLHSTTGGEWSTHQSLHELLVAGDGARVSLELYGLRKVRG
jgi:hypothetical protein